MFLNENQVLMNSNSLMLSEASRSMTELNFIQKLIGNAKTEDDLKKISKSKIFKKKHKDFKISDIYAFGQSRGLTANQIDGKVEEVKAEIEPHVQLAGIAIGFFMPFLLLLAVFLLLKILDEKKFMEYVRVGMEFQGTVLIIVGFLAILLSPMYYYAAGYVMTIGVIDIIMGVLWISLSKT